MSFDLKLLADPFDPKEVDFRIGQAGAGKDGKPWAKVLAYVDARCIMDRLDDVVGPGNWKDHYWKEGEGVMCGLAIKVDGEWVEKVDGSEETDIEGFKGGISKALVRAGVKWGIGRYLYNLGDGWAQIVASGTKDSRWQPKDKNGKYESFNWLPPVLPEWAIPKKKPTAAESVAAKTAANQQGIKDRINGKAEQNAVPSAGQGQAGSAHRSAGQEPKGRSLDQGIDEFFAGAEEAAGQLQGEVGGGSQNTMGGDARIRPDSAKPASLKDQLRPGSNGAGSRQDPGSKNTTAGSARKNPRDATDRNDVPAIAPGGNATQPKRAVESRGDSQSVMSGGQRAAIPGGVGASINPSSGGQVEAIAPIKGQLSPGEQSQFMEYMRVALLEVRSMSDLSALWTTNVNLAKGLPEGLKAELIVLKNAAKERVQV